MYIRNVCRHALFALGAFVVSGVAMAQGYPNKVIKIQVPFAPGGSTDLIARIVAEPLGKVLGQSVIVENKPGGGGSVGAAELSRAAPDGYTLGMASPSTAAANPAINPNLPYNPLTDFTPIIHFADTPNLIAVHPNFPAKDYKSFVALLKSKPGQYSFSSAGTGSTGHMQMEMFKSLAGVYLVHIPYRGSGPALNDTVGGQVDMIFDNVPSVMPFIQAKRLIPIVVVSPNRLASLPDVPTFKEVGLEALNRPSFFGLWGPKGMPKDVVDKINAGMRKVLADPAVTKRIEDVGAMVATGGGSSPAQFADKIKVEFEAYKKVVERASIKPE